MQNRSIKFRVWDKEDKKFFESGPRINSMSISITLNGEIIGHPNIGEMTSRFDLMQFTGLKDKNEEEIYKGDIVKYHDHPTGVEDGIGEVYYENGKWMVTWSMIPLGDFGTAWLEVIGNIHETPELLNK